LFYKTIESITLSKVRFSLNNYVSSIFNFNNIIVENKIASKENLSSAILKSVAYYDMFKYPLKADEICYSVNYNCTQNNSFATVLEDLCNKQMLHKSNDFYSLEENEDWIKRRKKGNAVAQKYLEKAYEVSGFIAAFPFVRGIMLSGSLSKNFMDESGDIDYFIITKPNRLWVCRTLLILYKKLFLFNSKKYFCVNYFVDEQHLEITEKNLFTATELATLIPTYHEVNYELLLSNNEWVRNYLPNYNKREFKGHKANKRFTFKSFLEKLLNGKIGNYLDNKFMKITVAHWQKKFDTFNKEEFELAFKSKKNVSKHHPNQFQKKVLDRLANRISKLEKQHNIKIETNE